MVKAKLKKLNKFNGVIFTQYLRGLFAASINA